ncbi:hypothetical protein GCM10023213_26630 [Prosthecobacter algae]|uniref:Uncharacterized protein n=1 Tax=Prosthecobacter algae TaxID=1144682 RepID=A0ABP9P787_9BACT
MQEDLFNGNWAAKGKSHTQRECAAAYAHRQRAGALGVALLQMKMAFKKGQSTGVRALFFISGLSLLVAMLLALTFDLRSFFPALALPMPTMWAIHGTLNTFGFGLYWVLAWRAHGGTARTPTVF